MKSIARPYSEWGVKVVLGYCSAHALYAVIADDKRPIELCQLLDGLAHVGVIEVAQLLGVAGQRIEDHRPRLREHRLRIADDEQRADLAAFATLARQLHGKGDHRLQHFAVDAARGAAHLPQHLIAGIAVRHGKSYARTAGVSP